MLLVIGAVVCDQVRLALTLMHLKGAVNPVQFHDLAACVEQMGKLVVPGAELLFQPDDALHRIDGLPEFGLEEFPEFRHAQPGGE